MFFFSFYLLWFLRLILSLTIWRTHQFKIHAGFHDEVLNVEGWSDTWQLPLSVNKCHSFHVGNGNFTCGYTLKNAVLPSLIEGKDLGIWFTSNLKSSLHCQKVSAWMAFRRLAVVNKSFSSENCKTRVWAFKVFVCPLLAYATPDWTLDLIESVQRRFTKSLPGLRNVNHIERLTRTGLELLELRRVKFDKHDGKPNGLNNR